MKCRTKSLKYPTVGFRAEIRMEYTVVDNNTEMKYITSLTDYAVAAFR